MNYENYEFDIIVSVLIMQINKMVIHDFSLICMKFSDICLFRAQRFESGADMKSRKLFFVIVETKCLAAFYTEL